MGRVGLILTMLGCAACAAKPSPIHVAVAFGDNWALGPIALTAAETAVVKQATLATLRRAYDGFDVSFTESDTGDRQIRLDRNLMRTGTTRIGSAVSTVSLDGVYQTLLAVVGCRDLASCETRTRAELVEALGRGVGATAAHELGHQTGLGFGMDSVCEDCYDSRSARSREHFFGNKHWSPNALRIMNRVLVTRLRSTTSAPSFGGQAHATHVTH